MALRRIRGAGTVVSLSALAMLFLLAPGSASATVTAISSGGSDGTLYPVIDSDSAADTITVTCGTDANVKINGLDPVVLGGTKPEPLPIACASMTGINVDGGDGDDTIDLSAMTRAAGFINPGLCAPCSNHGYSVVAECDANGGNDTIVSSSIGALIGYCAIGTPMAGDDTIRGADGREAVGAGPGDDLFTGGGGRDRVLGDAGADLLWGNAGADNLDGGAGPDALRGGPNRDICNGGPGPDTARGCEVEHGI
jgi:Ca2+-binding RTX toxin-like protein